MCRGFPSYVIISARPAPDDRQVSTRLRMRISRSWRAAGSQMSTELHDELLADMLSVPPLVHHVVVAVHKEPQPSCLVSVDAR